MTPTIDKSILDSIVDQLCEGNVDCDCCTFANYDENDIYIDASVRWHIDVSKNWITIDGRSYLEGTYTEKCGFEDLTVDAWVGDTKVDVYDYIEKNLYY